MTISAKMILHSTSEHNITLATIQVCFPRIILAETNTHRAYSITSEGLSTNARSSRAVPISKVIEQVMTHPFIPLHFGRACPGMQAHEALSESDQIASVAEWLYARDAMVARAEVLQKIGNAKQVVNRLLEPWMWTDAVWSGTNWNNFLKLRDHPDAEPHFQLLARAVKDALMTSEPRYLRPGEWHLPYAEGGDPGLDCFRHDILLEPWRYVSAARCARVSYKPFTDDQADAYKDYEKGLALSKADPLHASPFEHVATPDPYWERANEHANFCGWRQFRRMLPDNTAPDNTAPDNTAPDNTAPEVY